MIFQSWRTSALKHGCCDQILPESSAIFGLKIVINSNINPFNVVIIIVFERILPPVLRPVFIFRSDSFRNGFVCPLSGVLVDFGFHQRHRSEFLFAFFVSNFAASEKKAQIGDYSVQ